MGQEQIEILIAQLRYALSKLGGSESLLLCLNLNELVKVSFDAIAYEYDGELETRRYYKGGFKGEVVATVLMHYADKKRVQLLKQELKR